MVKRPCFARRRALFSRRKVRRFVIDGEPHDGGPGPAVAMLAEVLFVDSPRPGSLRICVLYSTRGRRPSHAAQELDGDGFSSR